MANAFKEYINSISCGQIDYHAVTKDCRGIQEFSGRMPVPDCYDCSINLTAVDAESTEQRFKEIGYQYPKDLTGMNWFISDDGNYIIGAILCGDT